GVVILVLSSRSAVKRIGHYFYRPVCAAIVVSETKSKTGAFSASAYFDQRRLCGGGSYGSPSFVSGFLSEFCFVRSVLGDLDEELWGDALVLGAFGHDLDVFVGTFGSQ